MFRLNRPSILISLPWRYRILLASISGLLLCAPWLAPSLYWTAWVGWIPLLFALQHVRLAGAGLLGWVTGSLCFAGASYWVIDFVINMQSLSLLTGVVLAILFWAYIGFSIALACMLYNWLERHLPGWTLLSFPLSVLSVMAVYPMLFETRFAEAQVEFLLALQATELLGARSLDALMLLVSTLLFTWLSCRSGLWHMRASLLVTSLVLAWFAYGHVTLEQWDARMSGWELRKVGLVQPNDPVSLDVPPPAPGFSRESPEEMLATARLVKAGALWVAWPEARFKGYFTQLSVQMAYARQVGEWGVPLVFHDVERSWQDSQQRSYNSVAWLNEQGQLADRYRKMRPMPFGEYLPAFFRLPGVAQLSHYLLGDFLRPLSAGDKHTVFQLGDMRVVPKVCYETAFPAFVAESIGRDGAGKVLLFLSQDGWFGETSQPFQHRAMSIVRGVENRVPMIHLINNGPSVVAAPNGRVLAATPAFSRAELLASIPFSAQSGGSFYSRYPQLFNVLLGGTMGLMLLAALLAARRNRGSVFSP